MGGSVSRGCADAYSDVEIGVFWHEAPSEAERMEAVKSMGGEVWQFDSYRDGKAGEHIGLSELTVGSKIYEGTAMVSPTHMTVEAVDERISGLIDDLDTSGRNYHLAAAIRYGLAIYKEDLIELWKTKAASFPKRLSIKLVQENLWLGPWFNWNAYADRSDHLVMSQHLVWMQRAIVNVLAALNREYVPSPEYKWLDWFIGQLQIKPTDCADRLRSTFAANDLGHAVKRLIDLGIEVIDLVDAHLPEVNELSLFDGYPEVNTSWARQRWAEEPAYTLIAKIAQGPRHR